MNWFENILNVTQMQRTTTLLCISEKKVKLLSRVQLCNTMDCSLPGSSIHGIFQVRILEWGAISFSRRSSRPRDWTWVSRIVGRHFTIWATREVFKHIISLNIVCYTPLDISTALKFVKHSGSGHRSPEEMFLLTSAIIFTNYLKTPKTTAKPSTLLVSKLKTQLAAT